MSNKLGLSHPSLGSLTNKEIPLASCDDTQALALRQYLNEKVRNIDAYFISEFLRSSQSLELLFPEAKGIVDDRVNEWSPITQDWQPDKLQQIADILNGPNWYEHEFENGCSMRATEEKILSFIQMLRTDYVSKRVCIVGHGIWSILFWRIMEGKSLEQAQKRVRTQWVPENGSVSIWRRFTGRIDPLLILDSYVPKKSK
jgi:broad specificity phosphatase PhoE